MTLTCSVTSLGHPAVDLTWLSQGPKVIGHTLQLTSVGKTDKDKNITCEAVNNYTQHRGQHLMDFFILQVYCEYMSFL